MPYPHVVRLGDAGYRLRLDRDERRMLAVLPEQLRELLRSEDDPVLDRLFPAAYTDEPEASEEFGRLMRPDLLARKQTALDVMESTLDSDRLSESELVAWLGALNDLRLVLGTRLEVSEDLDYDDVAPDDPRAPALGLYAMLTWLQAQIVDALGASLPD